MRVAVLGTGVVGQTLAGKLAERGQEVVVGTRDVDSLMALGHSDTVVLRNRWCQHRRSSLPMT